MSKERVEKALGRQITAVHDANNLDESTESPELLAREAARGILDEYDEVPEEVMEASDGFVVTSGGHAIFMGHDGSFQLADLPDEEDGKPAEGGDTGAGDDKDTDEGAEQSEKFVIVNKETGVVAASTAPRFITATGAAERSASLAEEGVPFYYVRETETENGRLKPKMTLDELQTQVEVLLSDADPSDEKLLQLLRAFDEAKEAGDHSAAVEAAKAIAEAGGKEFIPTPSVPPPPGKPLDTGPGPGKNTGTGGGGQPKVGVPTTTAPAPKKPTDTGPGPGKSTGESTTEVVEEKAIQFKFPAARIEEFVEIAEKAGAGKDAKVVREGDEYTVTLAEKVGRAVAAFFKGADVVQETITA